MDAPERRAALEALFRRDRAARALMVADPATARLAFPKDEAERRAIFLAEVGRFLTTRGSAWTEEHLCRTLGLSRTQARAVLADASRGLSDRMQFSIEMLRAVANDRLEYLMDKARRAFDHGLALKILKEWMRLHGLYRQPEGGDRDLLDLIRRVTIADGPKASGPVIDAEFTAPEAAPAPETWSTPETWEPGAGPADEPAESEDLH